MTPVSSSGISGAFSASRSPSPPAGGYASNSSLGCCPGSLCIIFIKARISFRYHRSLAHRRREYAQGFPAIQDTARCAKLLYWNTLPTYLQAQKAFRFLPRTPMFLLCAFQELFGRYRHLAKPLLFVGRCCCFDLLY